MVYGNRVLSLFDDDNRFQMDGPPIAQLEELLTVEVGCIC